MGTSLQPRLVVISTPSGGLPATVLDALDRLTRAQRAHRRATAERLDLTPLQVELLRAVAAGGPPEPTVGRLAAELVVSQPTVTESIRALARKGLVLRHRDPLDRRRMLLIATPAGLDVLASVTDNDAELVAAIAALTPDRQEILLESLLAVIAGMVGSGTIAVTRTCLTCRFHEPTGSTGHHCALLGTDLPPAELRVDCPEHRAA